MACKYTYKGITYNSKEEFINQVIHPQILGKPDVILPIGTSGSGKSTFIKSLPQENLVVIEPDAMRVEFTGDINNKSKDKEIYEEAAKRAVVAIKQGKQVVFDTTNLTKDKRLPFIEAIKKEIPNANIQYKLMELNPELAKQRIKAQIARGENRANVPDSTIDRHAESYKQMLEDIKSEPITPFVNRTPTKTRRILEVQSDLFQKGRNADNLTKNIGTEEQIVTLYYDKQIGDWKYYITYNFSEGKNKWKRKNLVTNVDEYISQNQYEKDTGFKFADFGANSSENQFLQLLNKDNNWITFFVKSIIQDSAKKGYEKVLFPTGNTASKVEGHTTLKEFKKQTEDRIKILEQKVNKNYTKEDVANFSISDYMLDSITNEQKIADVKENAQIEINQLKQELERIEKEGFGALKPIYNFYENTVTNILKKQGYNPVLITDEYGNTWNEIDIKNEKSKQQILLQSSEVKTSTASSETLNKIKTVAKKLGIDIQDLLEYAKSNPNVDVNNINALADLMQGVVAISQGKESIALTEEVVHIATAMVEQTHPELITKLISRIANFKIYKEVFETYKNKKAYQLANGKPNIRKIKKEAVDKLLVELIINNSEGSTEFPELMEKVTRDSIKGWWNAILEYLRGLFGKSDVDLFEEAAEKVIEGNIEGNIKNLKNDIFYQIDASAKAKIDKHYNTIMENDSKLVLNKQILDEKGNEIQKRHYTYNLNGEIKKVAKSVTEKLKEKFGKMFHRTEAQILEDKQKRDWGSEGHAYQQNDFEINFIDKNGYALATPLNNPVLIDGRESKLSKKIQEQLHNFNQELIASYPEGTRFIVEKMVVNTKVKGMLASTVDFKAIYPIQKKDGTWDMKIDTLDWKFTTVDKSKDNDIPWYKQKEWVPQMGHYTNIDYNYGAKRENIGKARMIPFIMNYEYAITGNKKSGLIPTSIEIGKLDSLTETNLYLLPVPSPVESTGNPIVDELVKSLRSHWEKLFKKPFGEERFIKTEQLKELSSAIRNLHLKLDFAPLTNVAYSFLNNAKKAIDKFEKVNFSTVNEEEIKKMLNDLLEYKHSSEKFASLDKIFASMYPKDIMTSDNKKILFKLETIAASTERMTDKIVNLLGLYTIQLAVKQGIITEENKMSVLNPEVAINGFTKTWAEGTKLPSKIIKLATNLIMTSGSMINRQAAKQIKEWTELLAPLEVSARAQGKKAFDLIGKVGNNDLQLIKKLDRDFLDKIKEAKEKRNKTYIKNNIDLEKYNSLVKEYIENNIKQINNTFFSSDEEENVRRQQFAIDSLKNSIDINRKTFNGFFDYNFNQFLKQTLIEEGHYSKEYEQMSKNKAALDVWNYLMKLNEKGKSIGYLKNKTTSFFPLIEATTLEKLGNTKNILSESVDVFKGLYQSKINENQGLSKIDPETGEVIKKIPKYFTQTDKAIHQLSTDLNKVGALWIKSILDYENSSNLEDVLQTLLAVEKAKGSLMLDGNGNVIFDESGPKVNETENKNYYILEKIIDDALYRLGEDLGSLGNVGISAIASKTSKTEEGKQNTTVNIKKTLKNADTLKRALGVGLKPLIAIANWSGGQFQAFINSGGLYTFLDFEKNHIKVLNPFGISTLEKGLLDIIVPLNEDVVSNERRKSLIKEGNYIKWLGSWSFSDVMMSTNSFPEKRLQFANALAIIENSTVIDGKIVNIRQYLKSEDRKTKYKLSEEERKILEKNFESRVKELKKTSSLKEIAKIENNEVIISGVSEEELSKFRLSIVEFSRKLNGQMNHDNKAGYTRDTIFKSFMMFKTWIPKLVAERTLDINKNVEVGQWEYGRVRVFFKTWAQLGFANVLRMRHIINGTEEGLIILNDMLEAKRHEYYLKTGQELEITDEEFYDLIRTELKNELKELKLLLTIVGVIMASAASEPPEDASDIEKNKYKWYAKMINKITDEVTFYYSPFSLEGMTRGSILPSLSLLTDVQKVFTEVYKEFGDEPDKAHPLKYIFKITPVLSQFQSELLPYLDPELAKEMGIRITSQSRGSSH